ncbi:zinc finger HIT domain-containing protein 3 [Entomortierella parvispora]|uniref:Box C/D snoRNA protein 1 n=1 Tax=Entomortierella parvispora TaxID=205924 RepID=A0A9P3LTP7_9FUNG|nr:zinc finger HIT domain-containing protein 3 [Entomortierella parvispora]
MDFFSNAYVTRDVDPSTVKDGIQIREKSEEDAISTSDSIVQCEVCGVKAAKYKCPGCFCQTCSLQCSKQHKLDTTCSGVRSKTHFVGRSQYSEQDMMSDYNFLEEVGRTVDNAARENVKLDSANPNRKKVLGANNNKNRNSRNRNNNAAAVTEETSASSSAAQELEKLGSEGSGSYRDKQQILHAKKRGIHLIMMAEGLKKRKENNSHWRDKPNRFIWTLEWIFPEIASAPPRRILEHKNEEAKTLQELLTGAISKDENKDLADKYPVDSLSQCRLYYIIPLRHANQPALYPLKSEDSLQDSLKFKKVLEYPSILVLGPSSSESDAVDPILSKYTIEEPLTAWPPKPTAADTLAETRNNNGKRPIETATAEDEDQEVDEEGRRTKKSKTEDTSSDSDSDSDDSDSDSSDSSSSDSDDSDDEEEKDETETEDVVDNTQDSVEQVAEESIDKPGQEEEHANLELGQAILAAFNQDFGSEQQD